MQIKITNKHRASINEGLMGLFLEDINYSIDGGLYAEMIENRAFEFVEARGVSDHYETEYDGLYGWSAYPNDSNGAILNIQSRTPLNIINPHYLEFTASQKQMAFSNKAYDGICMKKDLSYHISFYAKAEDYKDQLEVLIEKDGEIITSSFITASVQKEWVKYQTDLISKEDVSCGSFVIKLSCPGTVCFDFISMMPSDAVMGLFRKDLIQLLKDMKPGFLRFPGGCIVEGNTLDNRYQWKMSVGNVEERKMNWSRWSVHGNNEDKLIGQYSHYNQSLGIGYFEYFMLCEYLGAKPLPVINVGLACQYQSTEIVPIDHPAFQEYIDDALDLIEFANGSVNSEWGRLRMQMGHPEPFELEMIGIGNEQWETEQVDFFQRYEIFEQNIHKKYPNVKLIGSAGPDVTSEKYDAAWSYYRRANKKDFVYAVDEHYYNSPDWFYKNIHFYDDYPRDIKVFAGEYAAHSNWSTNCTEVNTWGAALSEAAFLTGVERNADVVILASYAPLLARLGYTQWTTDLIWFDGESCYGSPSYYVQKLYSTHTGTDLLQVQHDEEVIPYSVIYNKNENSIIVKLVNITDNIVEIRLETEFPLKEYGDVYYMQGQENDVNTIDKPCNINIQKNTLKTASNMDYKIDPKTFQVIKLYGLDNVVPVLPYNV